MEKRDATKSAFPLAPDSADVQRKLHHTSLVGAALSLLFGQA